MEYRQWYGFALAYAENGRFLAFDYDIGSFEVLQRCHDGYARRVDEATVMVDYVYVCPESKAFRAGNNAQRFGVESVGATNGFFEYARENDFGFGGTRAGLESHQVGNCKQDIPANFERR